jgi:hypothetical protein
MPGMPILEAEHFLIRVRDRLSGELARRALTLFFDGALVRYILARTPRDRRAQRVALALDDRADGPCVIVTLDGRVVTCLAPGMDRRRTPTVFAWIIERLAAELAAERSVRYGFASTFASTRRAGKTRVFPSST